jgi:Asp-tRNA(Asn)/Glu-tRNA(Gln) amidotransferase A subunit family amidase
MTGWVGRPATETAAAVRSGTATAVQVVSAHLDRIAKLNPELGAFVRVRSAEAAGEAAEVDARADRAELPLAGVPVAIKDVIPVAGEPCPPARGLPGSVQLVAAPGGEALLLAVAAQLERVRGWRRHAPAYD